MNELFGWVRDSPRAHICKRWNTTWRGSPQSVWLYGYVYCWASKSSNNSAWCRFLSLGPLWLSTAAVALGAEPLVKIHKCNRHSLTGQKVSMLRSLQIRKLEISILGIQDGRKALVERLVRSLFKNTYFCLLAVFKCRTKFVWNSSAEWLSLQQ